VPQNESSDTHFFNFFSMVLGILIFFAIVLFAVARSIGADSQGHDLLEDPLAMENVRQGKETLYKDAIGGKGNMPPKGGTTWPDDTIRKVVDYMVSLNK
jgi:hypothetical protein